MKKVILLLLIVPLLSSVQGQVLTDTVKIKISDKLWAKPGTFYLDSIEIDPDKTYLDEDNIRDVKVFKGADPKLISVGRGVTVFTRKSNTKLSSLGEIAAKFPGDSLRSFKFIIDDRVITDTTNVRLEATVIQKIIVIRNSTNATDHGFSNSIYISVSTTRKRNLSK